MFFQVALLSIYISAYDIVNSEGCSDIITTLYLDHTNSEGAHNFGDLP